MGRVCTESFLLSRLKKSRVSPLVVRFPRPPRRRLRGARPDGTLSIKLELDAELRLLDPSGPHAERGAGVEVMPRFLDSNFLIEELNAVDMKTAARVPNILAQGSPDTPGCRRWPDGEFLARKKV